ncbi:MAG: DUF5602 domain-containing protein [Ferruginibacter sp.]
MKQNLFKISTLLLFSAFAFCSCQKETLQDPVALEGINAEISSAKSVEKTNTFYGPQTQIADGKARSFFIMNQEGLPVELGIEITAGAFAGLPAEGHTAYQLPLHQKAQDATPFDHIVMNWNPNGHPPFFLFSEPHFDFHFYTITKAAQLAIPDYTPGSQHDILPLPSYWPVGFFPTDGGEAEMGKHWVNPLILMPGNFTHTMIYGSYNGAMIFVEPMITLAYLQSLSPQKVSVPYNQPMVYMESNTWYPTVYNMYTNEDKSKYYVTLSNFRRS